MGLSLPLKVENEFCHQILGGCFTFSLSVCKTWIKVAKDCLVHFLQVVAKKWFWDKMLAESLLSLKVKRQEHFRKQAVKQNVNIT